MTDKPIAMSDETWEKISDDLQVEIGKVLFKFFMQNMGHEREEIAVLLTRTLVENALYNLCCSMSEFDEEEIMKTFLFCIEKSVQNIGEYKNCFNEYCNRTFKEKE
jgi:hypothetical protein